VSSRHLICQNSHKYQRQQRLWFDNVATAKRLRKGCDWIVANDVSPETGIMGGSENAVTLISDDGAENWPRMGKDAVATKLAARIAQVLVG